MNQKIAKKLRKITNGMVLAAEQKGKVVSKVQYEDNGGSIRLSTSSWRGTYLALKKALKRRPELLNDM